MTWIPGELPAIRCAVSIGKDYGYGNLIRRLQVAHAIQQHEDYGRDPVTTLPIALARELLGREWASEYDRGKALATMRKFIGEPS